MKNPPLACTIFWWFYLGLLALIATVAAARWQADSTTTPSRAPAAGSSSTGCPASTAGSSR